MALRLSVRLIVRVFAGSLVAAIALVNGGAWLLAARRNANLARLNIMDFHDPGWDYALARPVVHRPPRSLLRLEPSVHSSGYISNDANLQGNTDTDPDSFSDVRAVFEQVFAGVRPAGFEAWARFASARGCAVDTFLYKQIYADLARWVERGGINPRVLSPFRPILRVSFADGRFSGGPKAYISTKPILDVISQARFLDPQKQFVFALNLNDESRLVPADNYSHSYPHAADATYSSMRHVFQTSSCFRDTFNNSNAHFPHLPPANLHGFLQHPDTFATLNVDAPLFSQAKLDCFVDVLAPLWSVVTKHYLIISSSSTKIFAYAQNSHRYHTRLAYNQKKDVVPWSEKQTALFWRGSSTGGSYRTNTTWHTYHRTRLLEWEKMYSLRHPDSTFDAAIQDAPKIEIRSSPPSSKNQKQQDPKKHKDSLGPDAVPVDIGLNSIVQADAQTSQTLGKMYPLKQGVSPSRALQFKYLLVVDGNSWSGRIQSYLASNSLVIWNGLFTDWYLNALVPWVHYVPVALDFSDLEDRLEWLKDHDDQARTIAENARRFMEVVGSLAQIQCYTGLLLLEYQELYDKPDARMP
ncbi:capsule-associated protein CAP1 [Physocladia obscura]|uniref:Capsule-associated protein CAP1 n=1 Tax=Physocladia obscura TaxID=109957 RepID=A0AAD5T5I3_9FUNG|nr:capsule-associated protein CAP1 [Physocladia obscura]